MAKVIHICTQEMVDYCRSDPRKPRKSSRTDVPATLCGCMSIHASQDVFFDVGDGKFSLEASYQTVLDSGDMEWFSVWWRPEDNSEMQRPTCPACLLLGHTNPELLPILSSEEPSKWPK